MELATVVVIIGILAAMLFPIIGSMRARAERSKCTSNLRSLFVAANGFNEQQGYWPQIPPKDIGTPVYAQGWIEALRPYGVSEQNWVCPTIQRTMGNPDLTKKETSRIDYIATPFSDQPRAAYKWSGQPWFVERGDMHGDGNLVVFCNGQVKTLVEILRDTRR